MKRSQTRRESKTKVLGVEIASYRPQEERSRRPRGPEGPEVLASRKICLCRKRQFQVSFRGIGIVAPVRLKEDLSFTQLPKNQMPLKVFGGERELTVAKQMKNSLKEREL